MKTLKHGEQVKYFGIKWEPVITVHTLEGSVPKYFPTIADAWKMHDEFCKNNPWTPNPIAYTIKDGAMLCADYPGKAEEHARKHEAFVNATVLENGELVEIEGRKYTVEIVKRADSVSDPIHFIPVTL